MEGIIRVNPDFSGKGNDMKVTRNLFPCAVAALFLCPGAFAQNALELDSNSNILGEGLYLSISGVYGEAQDDVHNDVLDPFLGGSFSFGHNFQDSPLALELQLGFESADGEILGLTGDVEIFELMINARLDFNLHEKLDFYVGGGIGWAVIDASLNLGGFDATVSIDGFAAQFRAGLSYPISERTDLYGGVRIISFDEVDDEILSVEFGLRFHF